jgi:para-aminobenzoate synthetase component 1
VNRTFVSFSITDNTVFKQQMLNWATRFNICCFLDNHHYSSVHHSYECVLAAGSRHHIEAPAGEAFSSLKKFYNLHQDWMFGHFSYDLKNELSFFQSKHPDHIEFPDLFFFIPEIIVMMKEREVSITAPDGNAEKIFNDISKADSTQDVTLKTNVDFKQRFSEEEYIQTIQALRQHILRGDCYEINFCQEFYANPVRLNPMAVFNLLGNESPNPFSAFYKLNDKFLLCASPERYLKKTGQQLISQPIKGTWKRNFESVEADNKNKILLQENSKERSENVMVVDLVRNDLSTICEEGSVQVEELYGVYTFPQVHQMISTITGILPDNKDWIDAIEATFPMGSMTGAPKRRVMELIEQYERTRRGIFSGAVGYVNPDGDMDFNVVIRSILYNETKEYLSYQVGSGITFYSDPKSEYEECLLKASAIKKVLSA